MSGHWWYVGRETGWAAGLKHPHMSSPHGLGFPTIWWRESKGKSPERKLSPDFCDQASELQSYYHLSGTPIIGAFTSPFPEARGRNKHGPHLAVAIAHTQEHEEWNKHTSVALFGKYDLPHTVCPPSECVVTLKPAPPPLCSRSVSKISVSSVTRTKMLSLSLRALSSPFQWIMGWVNTDPMTALRVIDFLSFLLVPKLRPPPPPSCQDFSKWSPIHLFQIMQPYYTKLI